MFSPDSFLNLSKVEGGEWLAGAYLNREEASTLIEGLQSDLDKHSPDLGEVCSYLYIRGTRVSDGAIE